MPETAAAPTAFEEAITPVEPAPVAVTPDPTGEPVPRDFLPEAYRENPRFDKFNNIEDVLKSYEGAESLLGKSIRIPGSDASDKQRAEFMAKLEAVDGVIRIPSDPTDAEGWAKLQGKLGKPENAADYEAGSDEDKAYYHSLGLSKSVARELASKDAKKTEAAQKAQAEAVDQSRGELKELWGDGYDRKAQNMQLAALQFGGDEFVEAMKTDHVLGSNVKLLSMLATIGEQMGTKKVKMNSAADSFNLSKQEAQQQIAELRGNDAYIKKEAWATEKMRMLYKKVNPE